MLHVIKILFNYLEMLTFPFILFILTGDGVGKADAVGTPSSEEFIINKWNYKTLKVQKQTERWSKIEGVYTYYGENVLLWTLRICPTLYEWVFGEHGPNIK